jgi:hypothetical protein
MISAVIPSKSRQLWYGGSEETAQAMFDVDDYENYIPTQSESALRHLASRYSYDDGEDNEITLRRQSR